METLQIVGEGPDRTHRRGWSVGTWSTEVGTDEAGSILKRNTLEMEPSTRTIQPSAPAPKGWKEKRAAKKKAKADATEEAQISALDPEKDLTDPAPFKEKPSRLAMLVDPKNLDELEKIGGIEGLLDGLGVDPKKGLSKGTENVKATEADGSAGSVTVTRHSGAQWTADMEARRRVYGTNDLPERKSKSLLLLMWLAFKDKVLVSLAL